jgi:hypothetical protein
MSVGGVVPAFAMAKILRTTECLAEKHVENISGLPSEDGAHDPPRSAIGIAVTVKR